MENAIPLLFSPFPSLSECSLFTHSLPIVTVAMVMSRAPACPDRDYTLPLPLQLIVAPNAKTARLLGSSWTVPSKIAVHTTFVPLPCNNPLQKLVPQTTTIYYFLPFHNLRGHHCHVRVLELLTSSPQRVAFSPRLDGLYHNTVFSRLQGERARKHHDSLRSRPLSIYRYFCQIVLVSLDSRMEKQTPGLDGRRDSVLDIAKVCRHRRDDSLD